MASPYAEVVGDPVGHSLSPAIHRAWLRALGLPCEYRACRVEPCALDAYLTSRRADPDWRGCNVTMPHKNRAARAADRLSDAARAVGAANMLLPGKDGLTGDNSDVDGIAAALEDVALRGRKSVVIGAGGAARAALFHLRQAGADTVLLLRRPETAPPDVASYGFDKADLAMEGACLVVNATPLGMTGAPPVPDPLLEALGRTARGATAFDMVYRPRTTRFLARAQAEGLQAIGGLPMLIGQARRAFRSFFGAEPPPGGAALADILEEAS